MEYIEREALLKKQQMDADIFKGSTLRNDIARRDEALNAVANIINAPVADVAPVRHGKWALCAHGVIRCTKCGKDSKHRTPFCPMCGAKME